MSDWHKITKKEFEEETLEYAQRTDCKFNSYTAMICEPPQTFYEHNDPTVPTYKIVHYEDKNLWEYYKNPPGCASMRGGAGVVEEV